jgi:hypothetical protein
MLSNKSAADRREGPRRFAGVKVMITHHRLGLTKCKLRDIGIDGAFVETGGLALRKGNNVDLVLKVRTAGKTRHYRIHTKVERVTPEGVALVFGELDENLYKALLDIVYVA